LILEVCIDSVESAVASQAGGASRVELCANLNEGGTTPSAGTIELARKRISIGLHVMIRPRAGDFCYSELEFEVMRRDVQVAKELRANGVVLGILNSDGTVDIARMRELVQLARPMDVTFHRAFDESADPIAALEQIIGLGIDRILTSGGKRSAFDGIARIRDLVNTSSGRITIMAGSGITVQNVKAIISETRVKDIHVRSAVCTDRHIVHKAGSLFEVPLLAVDPAAVRNFLEFITSSG
jgi:copper homeostasis protein